MPTTSTDRPGGPVRVAASTADLVPASPAGLLEIDDDFLSALSGGGGNSRKEDDEDPAEKDPIEDRDPFDLNPKQPPCIDDEPPPRQDPFPGLPDGNDQPGGGGDNGGGGTTGEDPNR
jgi:hypothetical protein